MATQSQGIQQLLTAEKKAAETIAEARKRRTKRLKQAKDDAQVEIERFKEEKERTFKLLEQQNLGSKSTNEDAIKIKTDQSIREMERLYERNRETVLNFVLDSVKNVKATKHENLII